MRRLVIFVLLGLVLAGLPQTATAGPGSHDRAREAVRSGQIRPLGEIIAGVTKRYPGRVVDVDLLQGPGRWVYRVKMLRRDGGVMVVDVDARSNRILSVRGR